LETFFGDVMVMTSLKLRHNYILNFDFIITSFKNHYLAKSRNFRLPILKVKRCWGGIKACSAWRFLKICYKNCILDMSQLKFSQGGGRPPGYAQNQASYADFAQSCRNYARNQKNLTITGFLVKFFFI